MATTTIVNPIFQGTNPTALSLGSGVWNLPCNTASSTTYTGSGSGTPQPMAWRMQTGATASSSGLYRANNGFVNFVEELNQRNIIINHIWTDVKFRKTI
jgi:hypothetical protein